MDTYIRQASHSPVVQNAGSYRRWINRSAMKMWGAGYSPNWSQGSDPVYALINHGRWIVLCPHCSECYVYDIGEPLFCFYCMMQANQGYAMEVIIPDDREEIEAILVKRPNPRNRNWKHGETLDQLRQENQAHGIGV